ncbi:MAG TPA: DNA repair protein RecO [Candidatus Paceibacterota bacterium]|nr:DNA repair protein RecO [Verrucomicrobiota bacterium]HSA12714.1 DNA repair protein RecO [Candidatus Paceibacterota bacterium]
MNETATGLVFRTWPLTETSLIVHWLTPSLGRLATVAKGARRVKSPFHGKLDLFYLADFSFNRSRRSDLHTLREVTLRDTHRGLRQDLGLLRQASYCAALVERATETETPLPKVFELMLGLLRYLEAQAPQPQTVLAFESKLLTELGLQPDLARSQLSTSARQVMSALADGDWPMVGRLTLNQGQLREAKEFLQGFLAYHIGRPVKGRTEAIGV